MKNYSIALLSLLLFVGTAFSQIAQGPAAGSVTGGVIVNTDNFESTDAPPEIRMHTHPEVPPLPMPANLPPPTGPAGSNRFIDPSLEQEDSPPPITLGSFAGIPQTSFFPPDPYIAVGPNHIIAMVNSTFRIYDKSGNVLKTINSGPWLNSVVPGVSPSDPKVLYDHFSGRWVMSWIETNDVSRGNYLVSVSDDDNPLGIWYNYALPSNLNGSTNANNWADYQGMGFDNQAIYLTSNQFSFTPISYQYVKIRIVNKAQLYANTGGLVSWFDFWDVRDSFGNRVIGTRPSMTYGTPGVFYLVANAPFGTSTYFILYKIANPLTSPTLTAVHVPVVQSTAPPNAQQLGGGNPINGGGFNRWMRMEPVYMDSALWVVHSVQSPTGYADIRYVRISTLANTTVEDVAFGADGFYHIFPALMVDQNKNLAITFSRCGPTEYAGAFFTWRLNTDLPGLRPSIVTQRGLANYQGGGSPVNRWGDYHGIAVDPSDRNNLWMITEYANSGSSWGTWVHGTRLVSFPGVRIASTVASRDFGRVEVGFSSDSMEIKINNIGTNTLTVSSITKSNAAMNLLNLPSFPLNLATFDSVKFKVYFRPTAHGVVNDTIRIASNDVTNPTLKIALTGKGVVIGRATAGVLYAASGPPATSSLYTINTSTGVATTLGATGVTEIQGLAIHPTTRELYGIFTSPTSTALYRVSSGFGDVLPAKILLVGNARAVAFANDGSLYAATNIGRLYRVNITTGDTTYIGTASGVVYAALSLNPITGTLWASVRPPITGRDRIYTVNTTDGSATLIGTTGGGNITPSIAFDARGKLYGIKGTSTQIDTLIVIDTTTAFGTRIGSMGVAGIQALAIRTDSVGSTSVKEVAAGIPEKFVLEQNYPNPFNPTTNIRFQIPDVRGQKSDVSRVALKVYDVLGREVATLVNENLKVGTYEATFDGTLHASGTYFYKLQVGAFVATKKMILIK